MGEKKEYRSAIRSRRMIREAFLALLQEKPFEKITVTDIVKRADLNRSTFYAHYPDVQGVVDSIMDEVIEKSMNLVSGLDFQQIFIDPNPFVRELTSIGTEYIEMYRVLNRSDFVLKQTEKVKISLMERAVCAPEIPEPIRSSSAFRIQIHFFVGGILNVYQQWLQGDLDCSMDEINDQIAKLILSNADTYHQWEEK